MQLDKDFLILYGSQTGQAESIAETIYSKCCDMGLNPRLCVMKEVDKEFFIEKEKFVIAVVSSTGDGDPPENAHKFFRKLHKKGLPADFLSEMEFALLGLGDSNYSTFQGSPRKLEKQFLALGAKQILPRGEADDQIGLELAVEPWLEKLYQYLEKRFDCKCNDEKAVDINDKHTLNTNIPVESKYFTAEFPKMDSITKVIDTLTMSDEEGGKLLPYLEIEPKVFPENEISLVQGAETLKNDSNLRIPVAPQSFIVTSVTHEKFDSSSVKWQNGNRFPGQHTLPVDARVVSVSEISPENIMPKPKRAIEISILGESETVDAFMKDCDAGDSVYFVFPNPQKEVDFILHRLGLYSIADNQLKLSVDPKTQKRDPKVPAFIPNPCSLRYLLTYCFDIRRAPGRPLLRVFAEYAKDEKEKRRLLELCSAQGVTEFTTFVRQAAISIVDFMIAFPSSNPPIDRLIELLPRLIPRPYSVSSHQSQQGRRIRFVYSLLNFSAINGIQYSHFGVCSEWMRSLQVGDKIQVMLKEPSKFRLPPISSPNLSILDVPLILIGPGTGVAPFASFFQKILSEKIKNGQTDAPKRYLFYGTRDLENEFIFRNELESLNREGIISDLILCESQPKVDNLKYPKYVQDALRERGKEIVDVIMNESTSQSLIFACGDGKGLSKDLWACFVELFQTHLGKSSEEANALLKELKEKERYIEDVWS